MSDPERQQLDGWERHQAEQRRAWLRLSYAERLAWLEQAKAFVASARAGAAARSAGGDEQPPAGARTKR
jgi:hypothetical protein